MLKSSCSRIKKNILLKTLPLKSANLNLIGHNCNEMTGRGIKDVEHNHTTEELN